MTIEIELTDESSSKTLALMVPQLRLAGPYFSLMAASPRSTLTPAGVSVVGVVSVGEV